MSSVSSEHYCQAEVFCLCHIQIVKPLQSLQAQPTVHIFKIDAAIRNAFSKCVRGATPPQTRRLLPKIGRLLPRIGKFFPKNRKASSEEPLGLYTHKFPKRGTASLAYLSHSRLDLPRLRLGLPRLRLSRNSSPATEGFSNRGINFKDVYMTVVNTLPLLP